MTKIKWRLKTLDATWADFHFVKLYHLSGSVFNVMDSNNLDNPGVNPDEPMSIVGVLHDHVINVAQIMFTNCERKWRCPWYKRVNRNVKTLSEKREQRCSCDMGWKVVRKTLSLTDKAW